MAAQGGGQKEVAALARAQVVDLLTEYFEAGLDPDIRRDVEDAIGADSVLAAYVESYKTAIDLARSAWLERRLPEEARQRLRTMIRDEWKKA